MAKLGSKVRVHYRGTFDDGTEFDNSYSRGKTAEFILGTGMMIPGFDRAVQGLSVGETVDITIEPEDAYGEYREELVQIVPLSYLPNSEALRVGEDIVISQGEGEQAQSFRMYVADIKDGKVTLDGNHKLCGKRLHFMIELVDEVIIAPPGQSNAARKAV